eukprot:55400-Chlamydomonas_euryale.AAC.1
MALGGGGAAGRPHRAASQGVVAGRPHRAASQGSAAGRPLITLNVRVVQSGDCAQLAIDTERLDVAVCGLQEVRCLDAGENALHKGWRMLWAGGAIRHGGLGALLQRAPWQGAPDRLRCLQLAPWPAHLH